MGAPSTLEQQSIRIFREACHSFTQSSLLCPMGKDANVWIRFAKERCVLPRNADFARGVKRFRLPGFHPATHPIPGSAATDRGGIAVRRAANVSELEGRAQDHRGRNAMRKPRANGFL